MREGCRKLGIPPASYYAYVHGNTTPDIETLEKICKNTGKTISWLIGEGEQGSINPVDTTRPTDLLTTYSLSRVAEELESMTEAQKARYLAGIIDLAADIKQQ